MLGLLDSLEFLPSVESEGLCREEQLLVHRLFFQIRVLP